MTDRTHTEHGEEGQPLPDFPDLALFVAGLFQRLGGRLQIYEGRRSVWRPEAAFFQIEGDGLPQMPNAKPHELFHSDAEWRGALKVVEYWLARLSSADKDLIFTFFASLRTGAPGKFDFRERLQ